MPPREGIEGAPECAQSVPRAALVTVPVRYHPQLRDPAILAIRNRDGLREMGRILRSDREGKKTIALANCG